VASRRLLHLSEYSILTITIFLLFRQKLEDAEHNAVASLFVADAFQWEAHGECAITGASVCHGSTGAREVTHGAEGCGTHRLQNLGMRCRVVTGV